MSKTDRKAKLTNWAKNEQMHLGNETLFYVLEKIQTTKCNIVKSDGIKASLKAWIKTANSKKMFQQLFPVTWSISSLTHAQSNIYKKNNTKQCWQQLHQSYW